MGALRLAVPALPATVAHTTPPPLVEALPVTRLHFTAAPFRPRDTTRFVIAAASVVGLRVHDRDDGIVAVSASRLTTDPHLVVSLIGRHMTAGDSTVAAWADVDQPSVATVAHVVAHRGLADRRTPAGRSVPGRPAGTPNRTHSAVQVGVCPRTVITPVVG